MKSKCYPWILCIIDFIATTHSQYDINTFATLQTAIWKISFQTSVLPKAEFISYKIIHSFIFGDGIFDVLRVSQALLLKALLSLFKKYILTPNLSFSFRFWFVYLICSSLSLSLLSSLSSPHTSCGDPPHPHAVRGGAWGGRVGRRTRRGGGTRTQRQRLRRILQVGKTPTH